MSHDFGIFGNVYLVAYVLDEIAYFPSVEFFILGRGERTSGQGVFAAYVFNIRHSTGTAVGIKGNGEGFWLYNDIFPKRLYFDIFGNVYLVAHVLSRFAYLPSVEFFVFGRGERTSGQCVFAAYVFNSRHSTGTTVGIKGNGILGVRRFRLENNGVSGKMVGGEYRKAVFEYAVHIRLVSFAVYVVNFCDIVRGDFLVEGQTNGRFSVFERRAVQGDLGNELRVCDARRFQVGAYHVDGEFNGLVSDSVYRFFIEHYHHVAYGKSQRGSRVFRVFEFLRNVRVSHVVAVLFGVYVSEYQSVFVLVDGLAVFVAANFTSAAHNFAAQTDLFFFPFGIVVRRFVEYLVANVFFIFSMIDVANVPMVVRVLFPEVDVDAFVFVHGNDLAVFQHFVAALTIDIARVSLFFCGGFFGVLDDISGRIVYVAFVVGGVFCVCGEIPAFALQLICVRQYRFIRGLFVVRYHIVVDLFLFLIVFALIFFKIHCGIVIPNELIDIVALV